MTEAIVFLLPSFTACVIVLGILCYLGLHVLEREIIFIDIAIAQISAMGATVAALFFHADPHDGSALPRLTALAFTTAAAAFFAFTAKRICRISQETVIGVSYAIAAAATLFIFAMAAGGDIHMEEMLTGSILWVDWAGVLHCLAVYVVIGAVHFTFRRRFIEISCNYRECAEEGWRTTLWDFLFYATMGVVITYSVEIAGVLLTFSFLIIPAAFSAMFTGNWAKRLFIAWLLGIVVTIGGLAFSWNFDFSCGPSLAAILGVALVIEEVFRRITTPAA